MFLLWVGAGHVQTPALQIQVVFHLVSFTFFKSFEAVMEINVFILNLFHRDDSGCGAAVEN
jgi:hypothetical protein